MSRLSALQIKQLDNMNRASQKAGGVGTLIDALQYGSLEVPSAGTVASQVVMSYAVAPALGTAVATKAAFALTSGAQTGITAGITNPDFPRIVTIKGNASGITGNVKIYGTNILDEAVTDTIALNGSTEVLGVVAFKTVTAIDFPAETHAGTDTVSIGRGNKLGFPVAIPAAGLVLVKMFNGATDAGTVTADATVGKSIYAPAGTLDGTKIVMLYFIA